jgi:predicted anti-sigma-YlaC factor YlaD
MKPHAHRDCVDLLLDLVIYERYSRRLSPEMAYLFEEHLENCPSCREKILAFRQILEKELVERNFG